MLEDIVVIYKVLWAQEVLSILDDSQYKNGHNLLDIRYLYIYIFNTLNEETKKCFKWNSSQITFLYELFIYKFLLTVTYIQ